MKANEMAQFVDQDDRLEVGQFDGEGFTRLYFYTGNPLNFALFVCRKNTANRSLDVDFNFNVEGENGDNQSRGTYRAPDSKKMVEWMNFKLTMLLQKGL